MSDATTGSQLDYFLWEQTIIIWDWDDTIHPSYWVKSQGMTVHDRAYEPFQLQHLADQGTHLPPGYMKGDEFRESLSELSKIAEHAIRTSLRLGKVVVITNAETGWPELSCKRWLPDLWPFFRDLTVISARSTFEPKGVESPAGWKTHAFREVIQAFYSRYPGQRWKNVLSIGDGRADREALHRVTEDKVLIDGCRQKNVKFLVKPTLDTLKKQLILLTDCLEALVLADDHVDIRITEEHLAQGSNSHSNSNNASPVASDQEEEKGPDGTIDDAALNMIIDGQGQGNSTNTINSTNVNGQTQQTSNHQNAIDNNNNIEEKGPDGVVDENDLLSFEVEMTHQDHQNANSNGNPSNHGNSNMMNSSSNSGAVANSSTNDNGLNNSTNLNNGSSETQTSSTVWGQGTDQNKLHMQGRVNIRTQCPAPASIESLMNRFGAAFLPEGGSDEK